MDPALFPLVHSLYDCYFVEEVAHAVDKDHARLPPTDRPFSQPVRMAPDVSKLPPIVGCRLGINGKPAPFTLSVAMLATMRYFGAACYRVPSCIGPGDAAFVTHDSSLFGTDMS